MNAPTPPPPGEPTRGGETGNGHPDWYVENGLFVYTSAYHRKRGHCCGSGCRHCPYDPKHVAGTTAMG